MEFYEVINTRRSIRQFEDREISRAVSYTHLPLGAAPIRYSHGLPGAGAETLCPGTAKENAGKESCPAE